MHGRDRHLHTHEGKHAPHLHAHDSKHAPHHHAHDGKRAPHQQHTPHRHDHGHHDHHDHHSLARAGNKKGLTIALAITSVIMLLEFVGGLVTNSLALLSDSGHMLSDAGSLALSLAAIGMAAKAASPGKTFGYHRFEILAALLNGATLFLVAGFIMWEAYGRLFDPPAVASGSMVLVAAIGLMANLASAWFLMRQGDVKDNLNVKSAYLHVLGDALGSVGAIAAGLLMYAFGWYIADPIISAAVSLLILKSAWGMMSRTVHVLMEGAPDSADPEAVKRELERIDGVQDVHDLHIWTITSGLDSLTCHMRIGEETDGQRVLQQALALVEERFGIRHCAIQVESTDICHAETNI
ncbi:zinc transporter ZitB [Paenibacillus sp. 32O-W]|uniref:cation diffusion facilitator family transporter n=1 Tax=Paenibacillus sp. 32O-W TaxID=1695218 RepID=UPI00071EED3D|nr:cation diffusion facilitator family transporter [Paenibacillus sp. 32O-W]ALS29177.1 zinc transporter ZitB [Paenibacillus sp. 32O-W]